MAKPTYVWGIDLGQCALKALRCTLQDGQVVADAFDYVEYPKILSQPEADPETLIREALEQFLSRNELKGCKVAISVPGQSGLAKFFKPPPVDVKRIPEIVRYEARQQIPFPLDEVIWDFQKMAGGQEVDGFAIETEVGLFAMKREQVYRALKPFDDLDIELDIVQLAPLSIYNFISYDLLTDTDPDLYDPDDPPESIVVLSMGTDATDLVVTNGFRVWQRSIPLGGNHFTKQLTKELKLTFAKAEHLKRNARQAEDPKSVFQAMRPIFNDLVTEVQRSVGYFQGIDRKAKIKGVVLLGNTVKLPGLQQYVAKNLGYDVIRFDSFNQLSGSPVLSSPAFKDNVLAYGVSYGLCLQGLGQARLSSNLLPREIMTQRMIREKKPWAVASVGALMLAFTFNFIFNYSVWSEVQPDRQYGDVTWDTAESRLSQIETKSRSLESEHADKVAQLEFLEGVGEEVVGAADRRLLWLELLKAIDSALPWTPEVDPQVYVDFETLPLDQRQEMHIEYVESQYFADLEKWYTDGVRDRHEELQNYLKSIGAIDESEEEADEQSSSNQFGGQSSGQDGPEGPTGAGWVIELKGSHYYNASRHTGGAAHVRNTLLKNLDQGSVALPVDETGRTEVFTMKELGIDYPIMAWNQGQPTPVTVPNPEYDGPQGKGKAGQQANRNGQTEGGQPEAFKVKKYSFIVQFCWQPKRLSERLKERAEKQEAEQQQAGANQNNSDQAARNQGQSTTKDDQEI